VNAFDANRETLPWLIAITLSKPILIILSYLLILSGLSLEEARFLTNVLLSFAIVASLLIIHPRQRQRLIIFQCSMIRCQKQTCPGAFSLGDERTAEVELLTKVVNKMDHE
jgi:hypothetical protein